MDKLCQFIGPPLVEPLQEMYGFSEDEAIKAVAQYRVYYKDKGIFENKVYEGFEDVLKVLKKKGKGTCCNFKTGTICKKNNGLFSSYTIF